MALTGEIENIKNPKIFTLDEDNLLGEQDLLVLSNAPGMAINNGQKVAVTGVVRPFNIAEIERDYKFSWDSGLRKKLELEYKEKLFLLIHPDRQ